MPLLISTRLLKKTARSTVGDAKFLKDPIAFLIFPDGISHFEECEYA